MWIDFSPESSLENSLLVRCAFWKNFRERTFVFLPLCPVGVFFMLFCLCFLLYSLALFSQKLPEEIFSFSGARFAENFRERTLVFGLCVWSVFFSAFFAYVSSLLCRIVLLKAARKIFFSSGPRFADKRVAPFASLPSSSPPLLFSSLGAGPGSLSFLLPACAQAATPSRSAQPSMHSPLASSRSFSPGPGWPPSRFAVFLPFFFSLSLSLSLSLSCMRCTSASPPLYRNGWFASGKCIVLVFDHCNYGQGPASHLSSLVDGLPKESRVLLELSTNWLAPCAEGALRA